MLARRDACKKRCIRQMLDHRRRVIRGIGIFSVILSVLTFLISLDSMAAMEEFPITPQKSRVNSIIVAGMVKDLHPSALGVINELASRCRHGFQACSVVVLYKQLSIRDTDRLMGDNVALFRQRCHVVVPWLRSRSNRCQCSFSEHPLHVGEKMMSLFDCWSYASARNELIRIIRTHPSYSSASFYAAVDFDGVIDASDDNLYNAIGKAVSPKLVDQWDALAFSGSCYYDWFALRCTRMHVNCWSVKPAQCYNQSFFPCFAKIQEAPTDALVTVSSGFNGVALYKMAAISSCLYSDYEIDIARGSVVAALRPDTNDCEHAGFHACLEDQGRRIRIMKANISIQHTYCSSVAYKKRHDIDEV